MASWLDTICDDAFDILDIPAPSRRFQAEVPDLVAEYDRDPASDRFSGTRVLLDGVEDDALVGKGRPNQPCLCELPGSFDCHQRHALEEKHRLKLALGAAYDAWGFGNVGQDVTGQWTEEEVKKFQVVVKAFPKDSGPKFLSAALRELPSKSREEIICYYFSVHVPRRFSEQRKPIESDENAAKGHHKRSLSKYLEG